MKHYLLLVLVYTGFAVPAWSLTRVVYDPYASVSWEQDIRCKTQLHDHIDVAQNRLKAYDDAGYCAVSFLHYSGVPLHETGWKRLHWPPQEWFDPSFLASLENIRVLIPDAEHIGWTHISSPFLTTYLECYQDSRSRYPNPLCRQTGAPRFPYHYSTDAELVDRIHQYGGLANLTHQVLRPSYTLLDSLPVELMEICSAHAEYRDWQCDNTTYCSGWDDGPTNMIVNYDRKLRRFPRTWAVCVNDWHGPFGMEDPPGPAWILDSGYTIVLAPQIDLPTLKQRMRAGAMLAIQDRSIPKGRHPAIQRIRVSPTSIQIEATDYTSVTWIHDGLVVATSPGIDVTRLPSGTVRAEIRDTAGSVVFTQPWELGRWPLQCSDGIDNDGDGRTDHPDDLGCAAAISDLENPACEDDLDNDGDGKIDWDGGPGSGVPDPECDTPWRISEAGSCGLGAEAALVLPLLFAQRRRWRAPPRRRQPGRGTRTLSARRRRRASASPGRAP